MYNNSLETSRSPLRRFETLQEIDPMKDLYKLLIVDDSRMMRKAISNIFETADEIQVVGEAENGRQAIEMLSQIDADVITLDVEMPEMDGLTTLKHLMLENPIPVVMISTLTHEGTTVTFDALKYGAVDFIPKPSSLSGKDLEKQSREIIRKVNLAAAVDIESVQYIRTAVKEKIASYKKPECHHVISIGAAEGGYSSLLKIIPRLPADLPAACIVILHAESIHVDAFIRYLKKHSAMKIQRACDGDRVKGGVCYVGSGEEYITVRKIDKHPVLFANPAPFSTRRGSVNMLMFSVAEVMGNRSMGVILSGTGSDGNEGMEEIGRVGGTTIVQSPESCMYTEMSQSILDRCKTDMVVSDAKIAARIMETVK